MTSTQLRKNHPFRLLPQKKSGGEGGLFPRWLKQSVSSHMVSRPLFTRMWPHLHTNDKKANDFFGHTCYVSDVTYPLAPYAKLTDCCSSRQQLLAAAPSSFSTRYGGGKRRKAAQTGTAENRHPTTDGGPQIEKGEEKKWWGKAARSSQLQAEERKDVSVREGVGNAGVRGNSLLTYTALGPPPSLCHCFLYVLRKRGLLRGEGGGFMRGL